jgi:hypothetical protein
VTAGTSVGPCAAVSWRGRGKVAFQVFRKDPVALAALTRKSCALYAHGRRGFGGQPSHALLDLSEEQSQIRDVACTTRLGSCHREPPTGHHAGADHGVDALDADGGVRAGGDVGELTGLLDVKVQTSVLRPAPRGLARPAGVPIRGRGPARLCPVQTLE